MKTEFKNIKKALETENSDNLKYQLDKINNFAADDNFKTELAALEWLQRGNLNKRTYYKGTLEVVREKTLKALRNKYAQRLRSEYAKLTAIETFPDNLPNDLIITVEWKRSAMWGMNPRAYDNYNNQSGSIGGCGYCKLSTATAEILNQHPTLLKAMYKIKDANINKSNRELLSYGSGSGIIPRFEGGVGVNCHVTILARLGYTMRSISDTRSTNVYLITRDQVRT